MINTAVENAKMAEKQIRRARGAYAGLFLLMVRIRRSRHGMIAKMAEVVGWFLGYLRAIDFSKCAARKVHSINLIFTVPSTGCSIKFVDDVLFQLS